MLLPRLNCLVVTRHLLILATATRYQAISGLRDSSYPVTRCCRGDLFSRLLFTCSSFTFSFAPFPLDSFLSSRRGTCLSIIGVLRRKTRFFLWELPTTNPL